MDNQDVRVYLDLEYAYPGMQAGQGRPTNAQVVQIAAIIFDNLRMDGQVHNALHDVRSMAAAVHELEKQD